VKPILVKGGRIIDPSQGIDRIADLLAEDGVVRGIDGQIAPPDGAEVIAATGLVVCPGFIDLHCHLREPGYEYKETIATGTRAAARGGFTTVCAMPNTNPPMDTSATIDYVLTRAQEEGAVRVLPIGCVTKGSNGKELAEMWELAQAGAIGFSDDGHPIADSNIMRQALSYSSSLGLPIINHCEVPELSRGGLMHEGWVSTRLGLKGVPGSAEDAMAARDIALAELTGGRYHVAHISTAGALELVRRAKDKGLNVTCEVTPHHLTLSDEAILGIPHPQSPSPHVWRGGAGGEVAFAPLTPHAYDTHAKVNPPLRSRMDVEAMVEGLREGVIDFIATDHAPHNRVEKLCTFDEAAFGISVLETALGQLMSLVHAGAIPLPLLIEKLTLAPARFLGRRDLGTLRVGAPADIAIFDPDAEWVVDASRFASRGKNTPLDGVTLRGQVVATVVGGEVKYKTMSL
jgi:dihydroorotase